MGKSEAGQNLRMNQPVSIFFFFPWVIVCVGSGYAAFPVLSLSLSKFMSFPSWSVRFVKALTAGSSKDKWVYGTHRDSYRQQQSWRLQISREDLQRLQTSCAQTITTMGFELFHSIEQARNFSVPLYQSSAVAENAAAIVPVAPASAAEEAGAAIFPKVTVAADESAGSVNGAAGDHTVPVASDGSASNLFTYKHCDVLPDDGPSS